MKRINYMKTPFLLVLAVPLLAASTPGQFPIVNGVDHQFRVISIAAVKQVMLGMTRLQVYRTIGSPHFSEGISARVWNYAFQLRSQGTGEAMNCKMQLRYEKGRTIGILWDDPVCAKLLG
jgi:outer membrane protein assembly factor BamE (lipoprotein component of BamABCDE complex)